MGPEIGPKPGDVVHVGWCLKGGVPEAVVAAVSDDNLLTLPGLSARSDTLQGMVEQTKGPGVHLQWIATWPQVMRIYATDFPQIVVGLVEAPPPRRKKYDPAPKDEPQPSAVRVAL